MVAIHQGCEVGFQFLVGQGDWRVEGQPQTDANFKLTLLSERPDGREHGANFFKPPLETQVHGFLLAPDFALTVGRYRGMDLRCFGSVRPGSKETVVETIAVVDRQDYLGELDQLEFAQFVPDVGQHLARSAGPYHGLRSTARP